MNIKKINFKLFLVIALVLIIASSMFFASGTKVFAQNSGTGLVPCVDNCGFKQIGDLINKVVSFVVFDMAVPIAAIMFAYAGFELITSGGETSKREKAKKIFTNVAIGLAFAAAAFLIVHFILGVMGADPSWDWFGF